MVARLIQPFTFIGGKVSLGIEKPDEDTETAENGSEVTDGAVSDEMAGPSGSGRRARS